MKWVTRTLVASSTIAMVSVAALPAHAYIFTTRTGSTFNTSGFYRLYGDSSFTAETNTLVTIRPKITSSCSSAGAFGARLMREQRLQPDVTVVITYAGSNCNEPTSGQGTIAGGPAHVDFRNYAPRRSAQVKVCYNGC